MLNRSMKPPRSGGAPFFPLAFFVSLIRCTPWQYGIVRETAFTHTYAQAHLPHTLSHKTIHFTTDNATITSLKKGTPNHTSNHSTHISVVSTDIARLSGNHPCPWASSGGRALLHHTACRVHTTTFYFCSTTSQFSSQQHGPSTCVTR